MRPFDRFVNLNENGSGGPAYRRCRFLGGADKRGGCKAPALLYSSAAMPRKAAVGLFQLIQLF